MEFKIIHGLFLLLVTFCVAVESSPFQDCGSTVGKVSAVTVSGCTAAPCVLKKGGNASFEIDFTALSPITKITAVIHGILAGMPIPFPFGHPDGCKDSNLSCPLKPNKAYKYKTVLAIKSSYPSIQVMVKWELKTQNSKDLVCVEIPVKITS